jgi:hypothetical protein
MISLVKAGDTFSNSNVTAIHPDFAFGLKQSPVPRMDLRNGAADLAKDRHGRDLNIAKGD